SFEHDSLRAVCRPRARSARPRSDGARKARRRVVARRSVRARLTWPIAGERETFGITVGLSRAAVSRGHAGGTFCARRAISLDELGGARWLEGATLRKRARGEARRPSRRLMTGATRLRSFMSTRTPSG